MNNDAFAVPIEEGPREYLVRTGAFMTNNVDVMNVVGSQLEILN
jgi:hypothetical protein